MEIHDPRYNADLGAGFRVKWADEDDVAAYGRLADTVFRMSSDAPMRDLNARAIAEWASGHPTTDVTNIAVVVDAHGTVVAGAILLRQGLDYSGVQLGVGRPEAVVCHPDHRNKGFIREIMRCLHAKSHARGDHLQAISGIPYFYRQYGYAYAITYDGQAVVPFSSIAPWQSGTPRYAVRKAAADEYQAFVALYDADRLGRGLLCTTPLERSYFIHLTTVSSQAFIIDPYFFVDTTDNRILGYTLLYRSQYGANIAVLGAGLQPELSWHQLLPGFLTALADHRPKVRLTSSTSVELSGVSFVLDDKHPLLNQLSYGFSPELSPPYCWYIRVDDYARFFDAIRPILEARLRKSSMRGYSGTVTVSLYGSAYALEWESGSLVWASAVALPVMGSGADAGYPADSFAMQIFGRTSYREIKQWHHEAWASHTAEQLLTILFPTGASWFLWLN